MTAPRYPLLDHTSFPHILDLIVDFAAEDVPSALALRGASSSLRDAVDSRLFSHVVVIEKLKQPVEFRSLVPPHHRLPYYQSFDDDDSAYVKNIASRVRMRGYIRRADYFHQPTYPPPDPETVLKIEHVRRLQSSEYVYPRYEDLAFVGTTALDFADITGGGLTIHPFMDVQSAIGTERHVIHINYDPAHPQLYQSIYRIRIAPTVRELVYVLNPYPESKPYTGVKDHLSGHLGMLYGLLTSMMPVLGRGGKVTFVGVDEIPHVHLDVPTGLPASELIPTVETQVSVWINEWEEFLFDQPSQFGYGIDGISWEAEDIERSVKSVVFLTLEEWRKSLPPDSLDDVAPSYTVPDAWQPALKATTAFIDFGDDDDFEDDDDFIDEDDFYDDYDGISDDGFFDDDGGYNDYGANLDQDYDDDFFL